MAITGRTVSGDLGEGGLGLARLARLGERGRSFEGGAGLGGLLRLPPQIAAPGRNRDDQQNRRDHGIIAVAVPQLFELFSPDFLVDFVKDVGHEPPNPVSSPFGRNGRRLSYRCGTGKAKPHYGTYG